LSLPPQSCNNHSVVSTSTELDSAKDLEKKRICRIITKDFPQYFAVVSRIRQESSQMGPEGGVLSSLTLPLVQASFPEGALTKKIRVGLQVSLVTVLNCSENRLTVTLYLNCSENRLTITLYLNCSESRLTIILYLNCSENRLTITLYLNCSENRLTIILYLNCSENYEL
jgi:hypothetical protein